MKQFKNKSTSVVFFVSDETLQKIYLTDENMEEILEEKKPEKKEEKPKKETPKKTVHKNTKKVVK